VLTDETLLSDVEFVAFDLETTGLFAIGSQIVEIGAVRFRLDGTEIGAFEQLIDPLCEMSEEVMGVHGISNEMVRGQPTIAEVLPRFIDFLGSSDTTLLAHNAAFDLGFLGFAFAKSGVPHPQHRIIDTLSLAQNCVRGSRSYKLEDLAVYFGVAECEDHRGLSDARLVAHVFRKIVSRTRRLQTVSDLMRLARPMSFEDTVVTPGDLPPDF
jgi:DNA polymerase III epsilon subunit family exonuclease